jgi:hypothetical protein
MLLNCTYGAVSSPCHTTTSFSLGGLVASRFSTLELHFQLFHLTCLDV